jgi:hypothetical protein
MVTHSSTSRPVQCLCMAERTGCPVFTDLWSYVLVFKFCRTYSETIVRQESPSSKISSNSILLLNKLEAPATLRLQLHDGHLRVVKCFIKLAVCPQTKRAEDVNGYTDVLHLACPMSHKQHVMAQLQEVGTRHVEIPEPDCY